MLIAEGRRRALGAGRGSRHDCRGSTSAANDYRGRVQCLEQRGSPWDCAYSGYRLWAQGVGGEYRIAIDQDADLKT